MKYKVVREATEREVLYVEADSPEQAEVRARRMVSDYVTRIDSKSEETFTCEGEWNDDKDFTVVGLRDGKLTIEYQSAPNSDLASWRAACSGNGEYQLLQVLPGKLELGDIHLTN